VRRMRAVIGRFRPVAALVVVLCAGCTTTVIGLPTAAALPTTAQATTSAGPCHYLPGDPAPPGKGFGLPADPSPTPKAGTVVVTLQTSQGPIPLTLNRAQAPCTVQSFVFLARKTFFDNTPCHRLTTDAALKVLQCGDPTGLGSGGPGYTIPDENPTGLTPAPGVPAGSVIYPAGTVAMANTGEPHSGGSEFFMVYGDSELSPSYAVFGTVSGAGLSTLDKIAAGGLTAAQSPTDGRPNLPVTITKAVVAG
jgi:peptidyl-prolyl cis-trans isomerase B (cyclophilin B)